MWSPIPLLQRYIFGEIFKIFLLVLLCFTLMLVFVGVVQEASARGLGPMQILEILPYIVPSMLPFTIPAALLLTVCVVYGRLAGDQEVTAAKAAGISVVSLLWPSLFLGATLSAGSLLLTDQAIPWAVTNIENTIVLAMEDIFLDRLRNDHQYRDPDRGIVVTVQRVEGRKLIGPIFHFRHSKGKTATIQADEALIRVDLVNQQAVLHLRNANIDIPPRGRIFVSGEMTQPIEFSNDIKESKPRYLTVSTIEDELAAIESDRLAQEEQTIVEAAMGLTLGDFSMLAEGGRERFLDSRRKQARMLSLRTEKHSRYALACSCFFFALLGGPFSILKAKGHFLTTFIYCFAPIVAGYYPLVLTLITQSKRGVVDPVWAMWVGNALLAIAGLYVLRKVMRH
ncbi:MAG: LptF/LptG family permease [Planctomycetaceae bacterium]